jgi:hypothetical protein
MDNIKNLGMVFFGIDDVFEDGAIFEFNRTGNGKLYLPMFMRTLESTLLDVNTTNEDKFVLMKIYKTVRTFI